MADSHLNNVQQASLAIHGGPPARTRSEPPMFPGGLEVGTAERDAVVEVVESKRLIRNYGPDETVTSSVVDELEQNFAERVGCSYALGVSSGTAALIVALAAAGVGPGDEVIIPAYTFVATPSAVLAVGAIPIITEVDDSLTLSPAAVEANLSEYTRAILPVHMRGAPAQMDELMEIAHRRDLAVIEDAAQACGGSYKGRPLGSIGAAGCFSLQMHKIITCGEGGVVTTSDPELLFRAKCMHDSASEWRGAAWQDPDAAVRATFEAFPGMNFKMPALTGAVANVQLGRLDGLLDRMRAHKRALSAAVERTQRVELQRIPDADGETALALIFFTEERGRARAVAGALEAEGVRARVLYREDEIDWHVYASWRDILAKRTWNRVGYPFNLAPRPVEYSADMCPDTLGYLERAVHINVSPQLERVDVEETAEALEKVIVALC